MTTVAPNTVGWLSESELTVLGAEFSDLSPEAIVEIVEEATWVLDQLTDGRFGVRECWIDEYSMKGCKFRIDRTPLLLINSVEEIHDVCGTRTRADIDWCLVAPGTISVCGCSGQSVGDYRKNEVVMACGCDRRIRVKYTTGDNLPPGAKGAVMNLATEYAKARSGQKCARPERVTSVSRQGVSWTILDPQDFMDKGLLGLGRIDHWLNVAKRGTRARARDPLLGRRIRTEKVECDCGPLLDCVEEPECEPFTDCFDCGFGDGDN